jgi:hypothetical protein
VCSGGKSLLECLYCRCCFCAHTQPSFLQHYVQIASRKLLLFHGRRNLGVKGCRLRQQQNGRAPNSSSSGGGCDLVIRLSDLVNSPVMAELQELLMLGPGAELERDLYSNWFSLQVGTGQRVGETCLASSWCDNQGPCQRNPGQPGWVADEPEG